MFGLSQLEERAIWIAIVMLVFIGGALYLEHRGAEQCISADQVAAAKQETHNAVLEAQGTTTVFQEAHDYHDAIAAPIAHPVQLRVCEPSSPRQVLSAASAGSISHDVPTVPGPSDGPPVPSELIGPKLQAVGRDADAQVRELQHYVLNVCLKR